MEKQQLPVRLLKNTKVINGRKYPNLYVQIGEGLPIEVKMAFYNYKVYSFLLANATDFERSTTIKVQNEVKKVDENGEVSEVVNKKGK